MNKRNLTTLGLAVIAITLGGIGFALAQDTAVQTKPPCDGTGALLGLMNGRGFWAQLTEEQATILAEQTQEMLAAGASHDEIREMKATMLQEWGIEALAEQTQAMLEAGATHEEIQAMKASMLQEWGIDAPQWSGPHMGGMGAATVSSYVTAVEAASSMVDAETETVAATATMASVQTKRIDKKSIKPFFLIKQRK